MIAFLKLSAPRMSARSTARLSTGSRPEGARYWLTVTAAVAGVSLLITTLEGSLLTPMLLSRASAMNQVAVFAGLLFWSWIWGVWGMLLAVPMMMVIKVICDRVDALHPVGHLLGE